MNLSEIEARRDAFQALTPDDFEVDESGELLNSEADKASSEFWNHIEDDLADLIAEVKRLQNELASAKKLAHMDAQLIVADLLALSKAREELAKFYPCEEGECRDGIQGIYHPAKVYQKEGE